jgi:hypothetical protein
VSDGAHHDNVMAGVDKPKRAQLVKTRWSTLSLVVSSQFYRVATGPRPASLSATSSESACRRQTLSSVPINPFRKGNLRWERRRADAGHRERAFPQDPPGEDSRGPAAERDASVHGLQRSQRHLFFRAATPYRLTRRQQVSHLRLPT